MGNYLPERDLMDVNPVYLMGQAELLTEAAYKLKPGVSHDVNKLSAEEEERLFREHVNETKGFDIDFDKFRYIYNYQSLDDFDDEDFSIRELMNRLSRKSLEEYNEKQKREYEFVKVVKVNYHHTANAGVMYFITFECKDPSEDQPKQFQAKVLYIYYEPEPAIYIYCDLKPEKKKGVHSIETAEKEDVKKPRID